MTLENYPGNKGSLGVYQKIINQIPPCDTFIELFAGSAVISEYIYGSCRIHLNDIDKNVYSGLKKKFPGSPQLKITMYPALKLLLSMSSGNKGQVLFIDPPYIKETRPSNKDIYKIEMSMVDPHEQLLKTVVKKNLVSIITHPPHEIYEYYLKDWHKIPFIQQGHIKPFNDCIWLNYTPGKLLTYKFLGVDFTDRQRIKRKINRWVNKLNSLPILERNAIVESIHGRNR